MYKSIEKLFGDRNKKILKGLQKHVNRVNALEIEMQELSDDDLRAKTEEFRFRLKNGETLEDVADEAFAAIREAARRTLGQRHYDVQLIGGLVLNSGSIAEMRTGEGKTLTATTAAYLNALEEKGVHIITVNDYLARRDADWMGQVYYFMGLTVGCIQHETAYVYDADIEAVKRHNEERQNSDTSSTEGDGYEALVVADMNHLKEVSRQEAYKTDVLFGTNNEFGFDYLRDNMVQRSEDKVQRELNYAIIDEVDSILIDEARTPLIISAPANEPTKQYHQFAHLVSQLKEHDDFIVDEKMRSATLTPEGIEKLEKALGIDNIYVESGVRTVHHIEQALKARTLFTKDKDYVVQEGEVIIIDEFTGRMMYGRRYSEGLHQAIEAKEGLEIKQESRTLATITLQNYFKLYNKLSGMTGTAKTEEEEFHKIYDIDVVVIPTHREIQRTDASDRVYKNAKGKYEAVIKTVRELNEKGQPVLIGTVSIEQNELMDKLLTQAGIPHNVLNAKHHQEEAEIIAQAGKVGAVTVATNMAGRGVDIILGGNPVDIDEARKVLELGGLAVVGTERHDSRRIDNQLRGRAGRQGDPGFSQFYVSMEDDLMRIFGSDRMKNMMDTLGVPDDMPIENKIVSRSIESAQKKVESRNFDIRKHLVEYDNVMNKQREVIYKKRDQILELEAEGLRQYIMDLVEAEIDHVITFHTNEKPEDDEHEEHWNIEEICEVMKTVYPLTAEEAQEAKKRFGAEHDDSMMEDIELRTGMVEFFSERAIAAYEQIVEKVGDADVVYQVEKAFSLRAIDVLWVEHLDQMAFLRDSINLQGYGQRDPLIEYKRESYQLFQELLSNIQKQIVYNVFKLKDAKVIADKAAQERQQMQYSAPAKETEEAPKSEPAKADNVDDEGNKIGRNDPCPCGSGKKYKKCHGA